MATVKELKATARPQSGKGAARAERRAGRVPGVIYGNNQPPVTISVDDRELRQRILAGRFLTTIYDIDLEGKKHRVIPRDFHLDPVRDFPIHVDFMRLGEGATIRVSVPLRVQNGETSPGVKRGGTVNIVTHSLELECSVDNIPQYIDADVRRAGNQPSMYCGILSTEHSSSKRVGDDVDGAAALDARRGFPFCTRRGTLTRMVAPSPSRMKSTWIGKSRTGSRWKSRGMTRCFLPSRSMS